MSHTDGNDMIMNSPDDTTELPQSRPTTPHQKLRDDLMSAYAQSRLVERGRTVTEADMDEFMAAVDSYVDELIGKDDTPKNTLPAIIEVEIRNDLRKELRDKAGLK